MRFKKHLAAITVIVFFCNAGSDVAIASSADPNQLVQQSINQFNKISDYTCKLDKTVHKNGIIHKETDIFVKYMKPTHYYFRWETGKQKGQEVIFVAGENNGRIVSHPGGLFRFLTLRLDPNGRLAMKKNRHPLTDSGMEKIMHLIETNYEKSSEMGLEALQYIREDRIYERDVVVMQGVFPEDQGFYAHRIILSIDKETLLPIRVTVYDWSMTLVEEYIFRNLRINVGFSEHDFHPDNAEYNFF